MCDSFTDISQGCVTCNKTNEEEHKLFKTTLQCEFVGSRCLDKVIVTNVCLCQDNFLCSMRIFIVNF